MTRTRTRANANMPNNFVSVLDYGAIGDGTTECFSAFNLAMASGQPVYVPPGEYNVTGTLRTNRDGQTLFGAGKQSRINLVSGQQNGLNVTHDNCTIRDLMIDGAGSATGLVLGNNSENHLIENIHFINGGQRIMLSGVFSVMISKCTFESTGYGIIQKRNTVSNNVTVNACIAKDMYGDFVELDCEGQQSENWTISNCVYEGSNGFPQQTTEQRFVGATSCRNLVITGNVVNNVNGDAAVHLESGGGENIISNNYFGNCLGTGIIYILNPIEDTIVSNNIIERNTHLEDADGNTILTSAFWISNDYNPTITITGNRIVSEIYDANNDLLPPEMSAFDAIQFANGSVHITGNTLQNLRSVGNFVSCPNISFTDNMIIDCQSGISSQNSSTAFNPYNIRIDGNKFQGTAGNYDLNFFTNSNGTGALKYAFITNNVFSKKVRILGHNGANVGSTGDAEGNVITNNIFTGEGELVFGGTSSKLVESGNRTSDYKYDLSVDKITAEEYEEFPWDVLRGKNSFFDYTSGVTLTGNASDHRFGDGTIVRFRPGSSILSLGTSGFLQEPSTAIAFNITVGLIQSGAFELKLQKSTDYENWSDVVAYTNGNSNQDFYVYQAGDGNSWTYRFLFNNANGTNGDISLSSLVILRPKPQPALGGTSYDFNSWKHYPNLLQTATVSPNISVDPDNSNRLAVYTSSSQYKTDVEDIESQYSDALLNLRPVWFRSTIETDNPKHSQYGLIAEEVAQIEPRLCYYSYPDEAYTETSVTLPGENEGDPPTINVTRNLKPNASKVPSGVQYQVLSVLLLDLVQKQEARIAALEADHASLMNNNSNSGGY